MRIELSDDTIKGIALVSVILSFLLDTITIENHHLLLFEKPETTEINNQQVEHKQLIQPIVVPAPPQSEDLEEEEKSFFVDDIQSIKSEHFDNISRTENIYHDINNEYADNGIPVEKYTELTEASKAERARQPQPYPQTTVKKQAIRPIRF